MKFLATTALLTVLGASAFAGGTGGMPADNYIEPHHVYDSSISGTVLGVKVRVKGQSTIYTVGDLGLTRGIALDGNGGTLENWAATALNVDVDARLEGYREDHEAR